MQHFIVFERTAGHCYTRLIRAGSLYEALITSIVADSLKSIHRDSVLTTPDGTTYSHPLAYIESLCKSNDKFDELQVRDKDNQLLNGQSWEIRALPAEALNAEVADVFCSAEPWSLNGYISLCRAEFRKKHPRSRARAFVWYLNDGPLVTFHRRLNKAHRSPIEIVGRYLIPWQRQHWPRPYTLSQEMVQEWHGTYDDLLEQLRVDYPL